MCYTYVVYTPRWPQFMHTSFHDVFAFTFLVACYIHVYLYTYYYLRFFALYAYEQSLSEERERESALTHRLTDSCSWDRKRLKISTLITF